MKFYVGAMATRPISDFIPGESKLRETNGYYTDIDWHTCNSERNSFTIEQIEQHLPQWKKYYDSYLPKGYRIILEPIT